MQINEIKNKIESILGIGGQLLLTKILDNNYIDGFRDVKSTTLIPKQDEGQDITFTKNKIKGVVFCCFPDNNQTINQTITKLKKDLAGFKKTLDLYKENKTVIPGEFIIAIGTNQKISHKNHDKIKTIIQIELQSYYSILHIEYFDLVYISQQIEKPLNLFLRVDLLSLKHIEPNEYHAHSLALSEKYRIGNEELKYTVESLKYNQGYQSYPLFRCNIDPENNVNFTILLEGKGNILDIHSYTLGCVLYFNDGSITTLNGLSFNVSKMQQINSKITQTCGFSFPKTSLQPILDKVSELMRIHFSLHLETSNGAYTLNKECNFIVGKGSSLYLSDYLNVIIKNNFELIYAQYESNGWVNPEYRRSHDFEELYKNDEQKKRIFETLNFPLNYL